MHDPRKVRRPGKDIWNPQKVKPYGRSIWQNQKKSGAYKLRPKILPASYISSFSRLKHVLSNPRGLYGRKFQLSEVKDQIKAPIHPNTVQPNRKFRASMAEKFFLSFL
ncbi:hypothetical protein A2397_03665 [Candidatus Amesbacteria bacterium RIFOXYB1_FULL_44_23]|uniref:Uncharacterized protein n=1 Tax=Candidatus Amesbacteria bacterium RIFOXYB1_FULL_44_23 TaxID=1797263 RepID=A0A1F4ZPM2_9BACT|nr:MAG: hypothetical protein A2397_03665 [Candidatus Amesbacteria bacterium RIFOXYB1_FULL_44_23]